MAINEKFFRIIKLLVPKSDAFQLFIQKKLTQFFEGLTVIPGDFRDYLHQVYLDIFPTTTRELTKWKEQFGIIYFPESESDQRNLIDSEWKAQGGQGKDYIQEQLQNAGFDVQVHENIAPVDPDIHYIDDDHLLVNGPIKEAGQIEKTYSITDDSDYWGFFFFIGGDATRDLICDALPDPATLPSDDTRGCAFSSDDTYLAVAHLASPYITIYKRSGDTFTKLADPGTLPTGNGRGCAFSSDDTYLAIAHDTSPYVTIYKRSGDTFTKLADPASLPTDTGRNCYFSSDDTYLAVAHSTSPYITIYKRSGDTFTKLADPAALPAGNAWDCAFSSDDTYLAVAHATSPYITIYNRSGDTFTKLADPASLPAGTGYGCDFSSDDTHLAVAHVTSPYVTIYKRSRTGIFFIESVNISSDRENEFKRLILKLKPTQTWAILVVNFV